MAQAAQYGHAKSKPVAQHLADREHIRRMRLPRPNGGRRPVSAALVHHQDPIPLLRGGNQRIVANAHGEGPSAVPSPTKGPLHSRRTGLQSGAMSSAMQPILVVEDIPNILELLEVTLRFKGYSVLTARNGDEALALVAQERPALVITDIMMPKLDGFALAQKLRTNPKTSDLPIIFISATFITPEDKDFAISLGAVTFLEKPVDSEELLLTVAETLADKVAPTVEPLSQMVFRHMYQQRLEEKLNHKMRQIQRAERLLESVPAEQEAAFQGLLHEAISQRDQIQAELQRLRAAENTRRG